MRTLLRRHRRLHMPRPLHQLGMIPVTWTHKASILPCSQRLRGTQNYDGWLIIFCFLSASGLARKSGKCVSNWCWRPCVRESSVLVSSVMGSQCLARGLIPGLGPFLHIPRVRLPEDAQIAGPMGTEI